MTPPRLGTSRTVLPLRERSGYVDINAFWREVLSRVRQKPPQIPRIRGGRARRAVAPAARRSASRLRPSRRSTTWPPGLVTRASSSKNGIMLPSVTRSNDAVRRTAAVSASATWYVTRARVASAVAPRRPSARRRRRRRLRLRKARRDEARYRAGARPDVEHAVRRRREPVETPLRAGASDVRPADRLPRRREPVELRAHRAGGRARHSAGCRTTTSVAKRTKRWPSVKAAPGAGARAGPAARRTSPPRCRG